MIVRCPNCAARYQVDPQRLLDHDGLARCHRCDTLFDAVGEAPAANPNDDRLALFLAAVDLDESLESGGENEAVEAPALPFDVPDDLEPLQAMPEHALGAIDSLYERPRSRWRWVYALLALLLLAALGAQLAWQQRETLLSRYPVLEKLCAHLPCRAALVHEPGAFVVVQRMLRATPNQPGWLTLSARVRNDASAAQHLPDIQLSLLDNNGSLLVRRRLDPGEYQFPPPAADTLLSPGEVFTIEVDFADPGYQATGFVIDFL